MPQVRTQSLQPTLIASSFVAGTTLRLNQAAQPHTQVPNIYVEKYLQVPPAPSLLCKRMEVRMLFSETLRPEIFVLYGTVWGNLSQ